MGEAGGEPHKANKIMLAGGGGLDTGVWFYFSEMDGSGQQKGREAQRVPVLV